MQAVVGAILILAGSVLVGAGIIVHGTKSIASGPAVGGYFLGALLSVIGLALLIAGPLKRCWDAIPVDELKPKDRG